MFTAFTRSATSLPLAITSKDKLRQAVAEIRQRQALEHNIGQAAIGRRIGGTFDGADQTVGRLRFSAEIEARRKITEIDLLAISPNAAEAENFTFAQAHGKIGIVRIVGQVLEAPMPLPPPAEVVLATSSRFVAQITWPAMRMRP